MNHNSPFFINSLNRLLSPSPITLITYHPHYLSPVTLVTCHSRESGNLAQI
ncbi:MAG: hypothetical protein OXJ52_03460 [Oligoflexia bacterium]|nr:hypothetical protein [Oligoflexia bacterium]